MDNVSIRKGSPEDAQDFSQLVLYTGPELLPALFGSESNVRNVMKGSFQRVRNAFSYEHSHFIEANGEIAAMALAFTCDQMRREQLRTLLFILRHLKLSFLTQIVYLYRSSQILVQITEGDSYLAHIAAYPKFRSLGFGTKLLELIEEEARAAGSKRMVLDVETDNAEAIKLYERLGYTIELKSPILKIGDKSFESFKMTKNLIRKDES